MLFLRQKKAESAINAYFQDGRIVLVYILQHHNKSIPEMTITENIR